jgi:hypothetical protein
MYEMFKKKRLLNGKANIDDPERMKNELILRLQEYKKDKSNKGPEGLKDDVCLNSLFKSLSSLLKEISFLRDEQAKRSRIKDIYKWFKTHFNYQNSHKNLTKRTGPYVHEKYPNNDFNNKTEQWAAKNYPQDYELDNRTNNPDNKPDTKKYFILI